MDRILKEEQVLSIIPTDFRNANKGKVKNMTENAFTLELLHKPEGIPLDENVEFYSKTNYGMLYFNASIEKIDGNTITVRNPIKHRYLKRRQFTRIRFIEDLEFVNGKEKHQISTLDLSAGGMKIRTKDCLNLENTYKVDIPLSNEVKINVEFVPIRIEKSDDGYYTLSGRFQNQSNVDRMSLVQYCVNRDFENENK